MWLLQNWRKQFPIFCYCKVFINFRSTSKHFYLKYVSITFSRPQVVVAILSFLPCNDNINTYALDSHLFFVSPQRPSSKISSLVQLPLSTSAFKHVQVFPVLKTSKLKIHSFHWPCIPISAANELFSFASIIPHSHTLLPPLPLH